MHRRKQMAGLRRSAPHLQRWTHQRIDQLFSAGHALLRELLVMEQEEIALERLIKSLINEAAKKIGSA